MERVRDAENRIDKVSKVNWNETKVEPKIIQRKKKKTYKAEKVIKQGD